MKFRLSAIVLIAAASLCHLQAQDFSLTETGYFRCNGVDAMSFNDYYPEGHQGGISLIMHGKRVVTNGDIRFEPTPGQWQPVPHLSDLISQNFSYGHTYGNRLNMYWEEDRRIICSSSWPYSIF